MFAAAGADGSVSTGIIATAISGPVQGARPVPLDYRVGRASDIAGPEPLDREAFNAALRALFKGVVIDYRSGDLRFQWHAGGESEVMYAWPDED